MALISQFDVLCGKDKTYENHAGNRIYRDMIVAVAPLYAAATSKQDKMQMTSEIVSTLTTEHGSRFLKISSTHGGWEEVSIAAARDKTSHALRFCASHMLPPIANSSTSSVKRGSKAKKLRKGIASPTGKKRLRRKVSFDEGNKKNKCVSPDPTPSSSSRFYGASSRSSQVHEPITFEFYNKHHDMNGSISSWCVPDVTKSVHDLSYDSTVVYYQPPSQQYSSNSIVPFTTASNADIETLLSYQLQDDDEFALIFES
jgi:hypothetical protein